MPILTSPPEFSSRFAAWRRCRSVWWSATGHGARLCQALAWSCDLCGRVAYAWRPEPSLAAWAATLVELIGGAAVMAGVLIPWASIPMSVVLLTALVTVHLPYGFFSVKFAEVTQSGIKFGYGRV